ncbi:MAG TPA: NADH-quinone oxidoreductase subunit A [Phycisphaerae bacterium]|nr:NADH-quinone oxidoreductase subunit A [Phycisphaerae bacterium]
MMFLSVLAQGAPSGSSLSFFSDWALLGLLFLIALIFGITNVVASHLLGPARRGKTKESTYESGVEPLGSTHDRFNVRFYLVAMIFLVFDVEVLFLIPWIIVFNNRGHTFGGVNSGVLFGSMVVFAAILLLAYIYAWGKGVFRWD